MQLLGSHIVTTHVVRTIDSIVIEVVEAVALILLGILAILHDKVNKLLVSLLVSLCVGQYIFKKSESLWHILAETAE